MSPRATSQAWQRGHSRRRAATNYHLVRGSCRRISLSPPRLPRPVMGVVPDGVSPRRRATAMMRYITVHHDGRGGGMPVEIGAGRRALRGRGLLTGGREFDAWKQSSPLINGSPLELGRELTQDLWRRISPGRDLAKAKTNALSFPKYF